MSIVSYGCTHGLENIVGHRPAFINMTRGFPTGGLPLPLMKEQVVLEVLEDLSPDDELMTGLTTLDECLTQNSREVSPSLIAYLVRSATER